MKAYVGVTDNDWYELLLATGPQHSEVNFWFPSTKTGFRALTEGEPFVFKTHLDRSGRTLSNRIVGVGLFSGYARATIHEAWERFGRANGVVDEARLRERIGHYVKRPIGRLEDPLIGCVLLHDVLMFGPGNDLPAPEDFAMNLTRGRIYDITTAGASPSVMEAVLQHRIATLGEPTELGPTRGQPTSVIPRVGQKAFKLIVAEKYSHHCAITGEKVRPVLEAAHILPVSDGGQHRVDNGLLLRSDVHTLFDQGYIGVDLAYRLRVSPALREEFGNGKWFYEREGRTITVPGSRRDHPNREFLEWHNDTVFRSA